LVTASSERVADRRGRRSPRPIPHLHILVDAGAARRLDLLVSLADLGGPSLALQLRAPDLAGGALYHLGHAIRAGLPPSTALFVNDRVDVALGVAASGVHLKETSLDPASARRIAGPELVIGRSVHTLDGVRHWSTPDVDYLVVGSLHPTPSHPGGDPLASEVAERAPQVAHVPLLAIGGVAPRNLARVLELGYYGAVVASGIWAAADPLRALSAYLQVLSQHRSA